MDWIHLRDQIRNLIDAMKTFENRQKTYITMVPAERQASVRNFLHYLSLRSHDVRKLQLELADLGLSSLGRSEGYVLGNIEAILTRIQNTLGETPSAHLPRSEAPPEGPPMAEESMTWHQSELILHKHTQILLGPRPAHRHVYIMVTAPESSSMAENWLKNSLTLGMNILRINAAHETLDGIKRLIKKARQTALRQQVPLKILVDIPGPKLRTISPVRGTYVLKLRPTRNILGEVVAPVSATLHVDPKSYEKDLDPHRILLQDAPANLRSGDTLHFRDARGQPRTLSLEESLSNPPGSFRATSKKTIYLTAKTPVTLKTGNHRSKTQTLVLSHDHLTPWSQIVPLRGQFALIPAPDEEMAHRINSTDHRLGEHLHGKPAGASHPLPWLYVPGIIVTSLQVGNKVMFDDGKIVTSVVEVTAGRVVVRIEQASKGVARLRGEMGINLPGKELAIPAISAADRKIIDGVKDEVDLLGLSFIRSASDIEAYREALGTTKVPFVIKVETQSGFRHLPEIMLSALTDRLFAVMIARGDLAVECGFERLAEVQEEILWFCEAAHVPVVWATQVLETLAKTGIPTRAEITDAAMSVRAECVMLNKGPFIHEAIKSLDSILMRMEAHQYKKRQLYRPLKIKLPGS